MDFHLCLNVFTNGNIAVSCSPEQKQVNSGLKYCLVVQHTVTVFTFYFYQVHAVHISTFNEDEIGTQVRVSELQMALRQLEFSSLFEYAKFCQF